MEKLARQKKYIAAGKLKQFISNLNNLHYRALLFTEFRLIFYDLANLCFNKQPGKLNLCEAEHVFAQKNGRKNCK